MWVQVPSLLQLRSVAASTLGFEPGDGDSSSLGAIKMNNKIQEVLACSIGCRQTGRTTALANAARWINALFITATEEQARMYKKKFPGLNAMSINSSRWRGMRAPVIFDHLVLEQSIFTDATDIRELKDEIQMYKRQLMRIKALVEQMDM